MSKKIEIGDKVEFYNDLTRTIISGFTVVGRHRKHYLVVRSPHGVEYLRLASECRKMEEPDDSEKSA